MLVLGWKAQLLAEVLGILVGGEARTRRGQFEQHPVRLAEVDAQEVLAVDDRSGTLARRGQAPPPRGVLLVAVAPGDVVHGPGALKAHGGRRLVVAVGGRAVAAQPVLAG